MPKLTVNEISKIENLYVDPIVASPKICSYCRKEITGYVFHTPGTRNPLCADCFSESWENDSEDFEVIPTDYELFVKKYNEEENKARKKLVDQILAQDNSFMYVEENMGNFQKGWTLALRNQSIPFWYKDVFTINVID